MCTQVLITVPTFSNSCNEMWCVFLFTISSCSALLLFQPFILGALIETLINFCLGNTKYVVKYPVRAGDTKLHICVSAVDPSNTTNDLPVFD